MRAMEMMVEHPQIGEIFGRALAEMLDLAMTESIHIWLIDGKNFTPYREGLEVTYDLAAGVDGSMIWPYTIRWADQEGGTLKWGQPDLFVDPCEAHNLAADPAAGEPLAEMRAASAKPSTAVRPLRSPDTTSAAVVSPPASS